MTEMRKPKIGDIVYYYYGTVNDKFDKVPRAAIITRILDNKLNYLELYIFDSHFSTSVRADYALHPSPLNWSWPEEEKPKGLHCARCMNPINELTKWIETKDLVYCENCPENKEKPKECEHRWTNVAEDKTPYEYGQIVCVHCNQLDQIKSEEKQVVAKCDDVNKAEELIKDIYKRVTMTITGDINRTRYYETLSDVYTLIKEYKGE